METNLDGAKVIIAFTGNHDLTPIEVQEAVSIVEEILDTNAEIIWGMTFDESFEDEVKVTVIATGFEEQSNENIIKKPNRDILGRKVRGSKTSSPEDYRQTTIS